MTRNLLRAMKAAEDSQCRFQHGAVLMRGGNIIAMATNKVRYSPEIGDWTTSHEHAEAAVLRIAGDRARGCKLFVARINSAGEPMLSEPCESCKVKIAAAGIRKVVWT